MDQDTIRVAVQIWVVSRAKLIRQVTRAAHGAVAERAPTTSTLGSSEDPFELREQESGTVLAVYWADFDGDKLVFATAARDDIADAFIAERDAERARQASPNAQN